MKDNTLSDKEIIERYHGKINSLFVSQMFPEFIGTSDQFLSSIQGYMPLSDMHILYVNDIIYRDTSDWIYLTAKGKELFGFLIL